MITTGGGHDKVVIAGMTFGGRYRLVEELGTGGLAVVWHAYDEVLHRDVAVKVLQPEFAGDEEFRASVYREAQAAGRLSHPHIASVFDYGECDPGVGEVVPYVVMERVVGVTLSTRIAASGRLPWSEAVVVAGEVASALAEAHAHGVVHRDIKLGNVMLTTNGAKVVDFGISALVGEVDRRPNGELLGTPAYIAPERLTGGSAGTPADVYALGILLYRMVADASPWEAVTPTEMLAAHRDDEPLPLPDDESIPAEGAEFYQRCLAKDPSLRPTSAEAATVLRRLASSSEASRPLATGPAGGGTEAATSTVAMSATELPDPLPRRPDHRWAWARTRSARLTSAAGVIGLLVAGLFLWRSDPPSPAAAVQEQPGCRLVYALEPVSPQEFKATVSVTNTGSSPIADPTLRFAFPGDQTIQSPAQSPAQWRQIGHDVTLALSEIALPAQDTVAVSFSAASASANVMPSAFFLGATACESALSVVTPEVARVAPPAVAGPAPPGPEPEKAPKPKPDKEPKAPKVRP